MADRFVILRVSKDASVAFLDFCDISTITRRGAVGFSIMEATFSESFRDAERLERDVAEVTINRLATKHRGVEYRLMPLDEAHDQYGRAR